MRNFLAAVFVMAMLVSACGAPAATEVPAVGETPQEGVLPELPTGTPTTEFTPTLEPTATETPTPTLTPTETPLPTNDLPTEVSNPLAKLYWYGVPTYGGDSVEGYIFRLEYDPEIWAPTTDIFGMEVLAHRSISYCSISATTGRGLPMDYSVNHSIRKIGPIQYEVNLASQDGVLKLAMYTGGDERITTSFMVNFEEQGVQCISDAETVLQTLTSISRLLTPAAP